MTFQKTRQKHTIICGLVAHLISSLGEAIKLLIETTSLVMALEIPAAICLLFLLLVIHHWRKHRNAALLTNWPVFGMMPGLVKNIPRVHDFATEFLKSSGGTKEFKGPWFANFDFWVTCDPTNMHHILNTNFANYPKGPEFQKMFEPFGYGIVNSESHLWKNQRKMLLSIIGNSKFESYMEKTFERKVVHGLIPVLDHVSKARIEVVKYLF